jgi:hypothetical protein
VHGGGAEPFYVWVEDPVNHHIYHHEYVLLTKKQVRQTSDLVPLYLAFKIIIFASDESDAKALKLTPKGIKDELLSLQGKFTPF